MSPVLDIKDLSIAYRTPGGDVRAASHVNLTINKGEVVGLCGESGSGKSTLAYGACRLLRPPAVITGGSVLYSGVRTGTVMPVDILRVPLRDLRAIRWRDVAIVFQSAMNALNPVLRVRDQIIDGMEAHLRLRKDEAHEKAARLLDLVGIPRERLRSYPHELSGGMRQRVMIAMALAADPEVDILAQIVELKDTLGFSVLFITHDMSLLLELCDRIAVMYAGRIVELGSAADLQNAAAHPYTQGLLRSFPSLHGARRELTGIPGSPPDLRDPPQGCPFIPRCGFALPSCVQVDMSLIPVPGGRSPLHVTACPVVTPAAGAASEEEPTASEGALSCPRTRQPP